MIDFVHLHLHTQYSILDGATRIGDMVTKAVKLGMPGAAVTDHGNLYGIKEFAEAADKQPNFKPIFGCETYVARRNRKDKTELIDRKGDHLILLAKNGIGYQNLVKLISFSWTEGHYYKPRIDKELLEIYHEGLIASSACLAGEIPRAILAGNIEKAEQVILEYKSLFGSDFYLELMRHPATDPTLDNEVYKRQQVVCEALVKLSRKHQVKVIATNDVHFLNEEDAAAHERLLCLNTGKFIDDPGRMRYTGQEWFKSKEEMNTLFADIPEALENTMEVFGKIGDYSLDRKPLMPDFPVPENFSDADEYLRHLTYKGAAKRYLEITPEIRERIDFELATIKRMGFPGYFLIVQDFLKAAREMDVSVGPGRGSAAGSVVAYCIRITDVNPLQYDLLFERFLNPDRISMPDIDIDFDEDGRDKVLKWVVNKYGRDKVAQVITFGTMAAKGAIRDVGRVQRLPLDEVTRLTKMIPTRPGITLKTAYEEVPELKTARSSSNKLIAETLKYAESLEGSIRQTGIHACGIIISKGQLTDYIPITISKESDLFITQFDGSYIEKVGMLKMDFLGLKTLAIIKDSIKNIKISQGIDLDIENIPFDDDKTYELFSQGRTTGIFQFESDGMKKYLKDLKPNKIEDLIAMNALYRPGPMEYIPSFINRKHGREKITYDIPIMEKYLKDTYGITVYQEQVMLLSQQLAGFTKGEADSLRKAMGKKIEAMMVKLKPKFFEGCKKNGHDITIVTKIWKDWEAFANYAFNKSHSTCYAYVAYRMAYLKAYFPSEFMAAVLSRNLNDLKEIALLLDECKRMKIPVLGPDVNESAMAFVANKKGEIRFGMAGIKNVGEAAVQSIVEERVKNGPFANIFDLTRRVNSHMVNKRCMESLAKAGAFDCFENTHRSQYFYQENSDDLLFLEKILRHATDFHARKDSMQQSLFGESEEVQLKELALPDCRPWTKLEQLKYEKEVTGFYMSGHPLDDFRFEIEQFCNVSIDELKQDLKPFKGKEITFAGIVIEAQHKTGKTGKSYGSFAVEDYFNFIHLMVFSEEYLKWKHFLEEGQYVFIKARIESRFDNPDQMSIRVNNIILLSEVMDKLAKVLYLTIGLDELSVETVKTLHQLTKQHKGKCALRIRILDVIDNVAVDLPSKKYRVNAREMIHALSELPDIQVKVIGD
ncbi:MAG: DNA polymerase III subunit alpha [Bacteroidales bacterium]|nr:DNA polymerase III subunit alpha [Bacteroidales bacterium]MDD4603997.1 DNA polymerase III subunit alpha [Bacteroidales bacterium]